MPTCRKCNKQWPEGTNACPDDGFAFAMEMGSTVGPTEGSAALAAAPALNDEPPGDLQPGAMIGEYKVDKKIGEGGMGAVYSATHPMIGKRAAIKVISAALGANTDAVARFVQEAQSVNQIGHPNIVDVFAFGELPDGRNYFVMEYLQGQSLADRIHKGNFPLGEALQILDQVADALEAAHEKQIVHRDLKPDNVYLAAVRGGRTLVKLLDFGIAKMSSSDSSGSGGGIAKTRTGMMMGTPGYLSPEQARGKNVDHRTDVYALGCMTFEIACGRLPFVADNAMDIVLMHMTTPPVRASSIWPDIPPQLDDLIARMLEKEANVRPSLQEVRATFAELVSSGLVTVPAGHGGGFGSQLATPPAGLPRPPTGVAQPRPPTSPPSTGLIAAAVGASPTMMPMESLAEAPRKSKTPLFAAIAGVVVLGGAGAFFALKGGDSAPAAKPVEAPQVATQTPPPPPETPKTTEPPKVETPKTTEPPKVETKPATIEIAINVAGAMVTVDDVPVQVVGKTARVKVDNEGPHRVIVTAVGKNPFETSVTTKSGATEKVEANLEKAKVASTAGGKTTTGTGAKTTGGTTTTGTGTTTTTTTTTTTNTQTGAGSGSSTFKDKNAPIDPF